MADETEDPKKRDLRFSSIEEKGVQVDRNSMGPATSPGRQDKMSVLNFRPAPSPDRTRSRFRIPPRAGETGRVRRPLRAGAGGPCSGPAGAGPGGRVNRGQDQGVVRLLSC